MNAIVCVDNQMGLLFNHRRVSSDCAIIENMEQVVGTAPLYIEPYSQMLFQSSSRHPIVIQSLPDYSLTGYQFIENSSLYGAENQLEQLIIYYFNRNYPSDLKLEVDLSLFNIEEVVEFKGHSHDKITRVTYCHK